MQHVRKSGAKPCNYYVSDTFYSLMSVTFLRVSDLLWLLLLLFCTCFPDFPWLSQAEFDLPLLSHPKINHSRTSQYYQVELLQTDRTAESRIWMEIIMKLIFFRYFPRIASYLLNFFLLAFGFDALRSPYCLYIHNVFFADIFFSSHEKNSACRSSGSSFTFSTSVLTTNFLSKTGIFSSPVAYFFTVNRNTICWRAAEYD